jgi:hypothetical protein
MIQCPRGKATEQKFFDEFDAAKAKEVETAVNPGADAG